MIAFKLDNRRDARYRQRVVIYALFLCMQATSSCEIQPALTIDGVSEPAVYSSLAECESAAAAQVPGGATKPVDGRFYWDSSKSIWYECLGRHVNTWQQP